MPVRGGSQRPRPADAGGIQQIPGRLRRRKHQHRNPGARLLSDDYADKVIVTTIQKLGLALDDATSATTRNVWNRCASSAWSSSSTNATARNSARTTRPSRNSSPTPSCSALPARRSSSRTPAISRSKASRRYKTTADIFQQQLHAYTITHAIEDRNVLRFHVDYYKPEGKQQPKPGEALAKRAIVEAILAKHDAATNGRKFNAVLATASHQRRHRIPRPVQDRAGRKAAADPDFQPLNIACVFSPPAEGNKDVQQIQEDLPQEKADNEQEPDKKKAALKAIIADYNAQYGSNHGIGEFDLYYQDVQKRIKDQQYPNADLPHAQKIDITLVVDMLLTGFDSKYLNTLYVDKNLKYHGLIQAFSRTNRVLNDTKPYGNILDFRQQQDAVDTAIGLFSGQTAKPAKEIWLVEPCPGGHPQNTKSSRSHGGFMQNKEPGLRARSRSTT
jgi:type I restriction enzyme R subunit